MGQAVPTGTEVYVSRNQQMEVFSLFASGADKEKGEGKQMASKQSAISKLS